MAWRRTAARRRVVVNLKSDKAIVGVLWAKRGPLLVLKDTTLLEPSTTGAPHQTRLDGEVLVERRNVDFVQVLPGGVQ